LEKWRKFSINRKIRVIAFGIAGLFPLGCFLYILVFCLARMFHEASFGGWQMKA